MVKSLSVLYIKQIKEVHFKFLHTIHPINKLIFKFADVDPNCTFCGHAFAGSIKYITLFILYINRTSILSLELKFT